MEGRGLIENRCPQTHRAEYGGEGVEHAEPDDGGQAIGVPEHDQHQGRQPYQQQQRKHQRQTGKQQQADGAGFLFLQLDAEQFDMAVQQPQEGSTQAPR
ncbi:hypothetical protein D3C75_1173370 [compost metagenome]